MGFIRRTYSDWNALGGLGVLDSLCTCLHSKVLLFNRISVLNDGPGQGLLQQARKPYASGEPCRLHGPRIHGLDLVGRENYLQIL